MPDAKIPADYRHLLRPIDSLTEDPDNLRRHSRSSIRKLARSLQVFGQYVPIVVREDGVIADGNGIYQAAKSLGWTEIAASTSQLGQEAMRRYAVMANRSGELSTWNWVVVSAQMKDVGIDAELAATIGFDPDMVDRMAGLLEVKVSESSMASEEAAPQSANGVTSSLVFSTAEQLETFQQFIRTVTQRYPKAQTAGNALALWVEGLAEQTLGAP